MKKEILLALFYCTIGQAIGQDSLSQKSLTELVVTAQFTPTDARNAVTPVRVIKRERIEQLGANNLEQLLQQELNINIGQDQLLGSSMSLQGMSGQNVKILIDGIPVVGRSNGNVDLGQINLANVERIEVVEGPASVFYGTDALAGVINLITKRGQPEKWKTGAVAQYESIGKERFNLNSGVQWNERWLVQASGAYENFAGFDTIDQARDLLWNPKQQAFADAMLRYTFGSDHSVRLKGGYFKEKIENDGPVRRPQYKPYAFDDAYRTNRQDIALLHEGSVGNHFYWRNSIGLNHYRRQKDALRTDLETFEQSAIAGEQDTTFLRGISLQSVLASKNTVSRWQWLAGVDVRQDLIYGQRIRDSLSNKLGESRMFDAALIGSLRYRLGDRAIVESGLRSAWNNRFGGVLTPSLQLKYQFSEQVQARATYARGFRSPDLKELFFYFVDVNHYILGNPALKPERSNNFMAQLSWEKNWRRTFKLQVNGSVFYNGLSDKIELFEFVQNGGQKEPVPADSSTQRYTYFNIATYKTQGFNLRATVQWRSWQLGLGASQTGYFNPYYTDLPDSPKYSYTHNYTASLEWRNTSWNAGCWLRTHDRFVQYYPEMVNGQTQSMQRIVDGFSMLDFAAGKSFWNKRVGLQMGLRNALNVRSTLVAGGTAAVHSTDGAELVSPGRSVWLCMRISI